MEKDVMELQKKYSQLYQDESITNEEYIAELLKDLDMLNTKPAWQSIVKSLVEQPERSISFIKQIIPFNKELERILIEQLKNIKAQEAA